MTAKPSIFIGIDPGSLKAGYAIVKSFSSSYVLISSGVIKLPSDKPLSVRSGILFEEIKKIFYACQLEKTNSLCAMELPFMGKNSHSFGALHMMRGSLAAFFYSVNVSVIDLTPTQVKQALCGSGAGSKLSVEHIVTTIFPRFLPRSSDESDAVAIALCAAWVSRM